MSQDQKEPIEPRGSDPQGQEKIRMMGPYGALVSVIFLLFWLIPIAWVGSMYKDVRFLPIHIKQQQRIACLFTKEARSWKSYHIQIQTTDNPEWEEADEKDYFQMMIFGYRSRLHRMLGSAWRKHRGIQRTKMIAEHIHGIYNEEHPNGPKLLAVRFIRAQNTVKKLAKQKHIYRPDPLHKIHPNLWQIFGEVRWDGKRAKHPTHKFNDRKKKAASKGLKQEKKLDARSIIPALKAPLKPKIALPSPTKVEEAATPTLPSKGVKNGN
jgi:hypothetical protein